jgi:hypothetical protein
MDAEHHPALPSTILGLHVNARGRGLTDGAATVLRFVHDLSFRG